MQQKIAVHFEFGMNATFSHRCEMIRKAGIEGVMIWWTEGSNNDVPDVRLHPDLLRRHGLFVDNAHASMDYVNDIWLDTLDGLDAYEKYAKTIIDCSFADVPSLVLHLSHGDSPPPVTSVGLNRIRGLVYTAEQSGIVLALENLKHPAYLDAVLPVIDSPCLGFCYDMGHDYLYAKKPLEVLQKYAHRLCVLHLHDNDLKQDLHYVPFDGKINPEPAMNLIRNSPYRGPVGLEIMNRHPEYQDDGLMYEFLVHCRQAGDNLRWY